MPSVDKIMNKLDFNKIKTSFDKDGFVKVKGLIDG